MPHRAARMPPRGGGTGPVPTQDGQDYPDDGREGRAVLASGLTWAWQAKYLFELDSSAYAQITKSVRRAIQREPNLEKYFVICPYDLPAGDTDQSRSAHTKWGQHVGTWQA